MKPGVLIWVTGHFGAGKSTLTQAAVRKIPDLKFMETYTTRPRREGEEDLQGELIFVSKEEYEKLRAKSSSWDHSEVAGNFYGNDAAAINAQLRKGQDLICPVAPDVSMLNEMKECYEVNPVFVWIDVPLETANTRLETLRPDRIKHHYQNEETRVTFLKLADHIFTPIGDLEKDVVSFVELIKNIMANNI